MSDIIASLRVALGMDSAQFTTGANKAKREAAGMAASINKSLGTVKAGIAGFAAALTVGLFTKAISNALEYAGSLGEVAQQLGVTTKQLQVYRFAAGQVGVSQEQLEVGLKKLNISLGQAKLGAEAPQRAFAALSKLIGQDIVASSKQGGDALPKVADALAKVEDRSKRAALEVAVMGKSGSQLDNLLSGGSAALNELSQAAEKLGIVLSDEEIKHADETADKLRAVKTVLEAQIASTVAKNADSILSLASALGTLSGEIVKFLNTNPQLALGIVGALLGGRVGGLPGAAAGALGGVFLGGKLAENFANSNTDKAFRRKEFIKAEVAYQRALRAGDTGGRVMPGVGTPLNDVKALKAERDRQAKLFTQAIIASKRPAAPSGGGAAVTPFLAPKGGSKKPREDHSAEQALRDQYQFNQEVRRAQMDVLQAKRDLAHTAEEQADLDLQLLDKRKEDQDAELTYQVALNKLTKGKQGLTEEQAKQLKIEYDKTDALRRQAIAEDLAAAHARDAAELVQNNFDIQRGLLEKEDALAKTASERRDIELRILDLAYQQEKARLEAVIADKQSSDLAKKEAQARLNALSQGYALDREGVMQQTQGPLENYLSGIPHTAAQVNEALQNLEVEGIQGLVDALSHVGEGWKAMRDIAMRVIQDILAQLIRLQLEKMLFSVIGNVAGGLGGGGGFGGLFSVAGDTTNSLSIIDTPGFATGGSFNIGGKAGVDRNTLSLNGLPIARVSRGERLSIGNDNGPRMGAPVTINVNAAMSATEARRTGTQLYAGWASAQARARTKGIG